MMDFALLEKYGIACPKSGVAHSAKEAREIADRIGYPVVLKVISQQVLHKTDVGGVIHHLDKREEMESAYNMLSGRFKGMGMEGALVQQKAAAGSVELIVGGKRDPQFGQLIMLGMGGIYVEVLRDFTFRVCPITRQDAEEMIFELRGHPILEGARGRKPVDKKALVGAMLAVSKLLLKEDPREFDINPLMASDRVCLAVDMRLLR
jgi:acyl-CoA synthetase (NDP forming)